MSPGRIEFDPVPVTVAGVVTTSCKCGWEFVAIVPEEHPRMLAAILQHLIEFHGLVMPEMWQYHF